MIKIGNDWDEIVSQEVAKSYYIELRQFLKDEYKKQTIFPEMQDIFNCLKTTPKEAVKVVILGQDPYHGAGQAHGYCFSVKKGIPLPPSLRNIYKEIINDIGGQMPSNGCLLPWAEQGVLLLNTVLTVREASPNSHKAKGWEKMTDSIICELDRREDPVIFMLWGANAKEKMKIINSKRHHILSAAHPSPLSAHNGFFGCGHFSQANKILESLGKAPIDWQIK